MSTVKFDFSPAYREENLERTMSLPMVTQLRFARSEFQRCLAGLSPEDAVKRLQPMNSIGWMIGHLANQEQFYWVIVSQDTIVDSALNDLVGSGRPASTPPLDTMWSTWQEITTKADIFLDTLTPNLLDEYPVYKDKPLAETYGKMLLRNIYHYWFHTGEAHAVRQLLGHPDLPEFVGKMQDVEY